MWAWAASQLMANNFRKEIKIHWIVCFFLRIKVCNCLLFYEFLIKIVYTTYLFYQRDRTSGGFISFWSKPFFRSFIRNFSFRKQIEVTVPLFPSEGIPAEIEGSQRFNLSRDCFCSFLYLPLGHLHKAPPYCPRDYFFEHTDSIAVTTQPVRVLQSWVFRVYTFMNKQI